VRKKVRSMKGIEYLLIGAVVALVAVTLPVVSQTVYAADIGYIEKLVPAESVEVETGGGETAWVLMAPFERGNDTGYIEKLLPAESFVEAETGAGETVRVLMAPSERGHDTGRIELLVPAE
jgi:hypothetical protein